MAKSLEAVPVLVELCGAPYSLQTNGLVCSNASACSPSSASMALKMLVVPSVRKLLNVTAVLLCYRCPALHLGARLEAS